MACCQLGEARALCGRDLHLLASASAVPAIDEDVPDRGIFSLRPAPRWEEGLLIGNGRMGGVVLGRPGVSSYLNMVWVFRGTLKRWCIVEKV